MNTRIMGFALVGIALFFAAPFILRASNTTEEVAIVTRVETPSQQEKIPARPTMTRGQFQRIKTGMNYAQCLDITGGKGEKAVAKHASTSGITEVQVWYDADGRTEFRLGFREGRVASKGMGSFPEANARAQERIRAIRAKTRVINDAEARQFEERAYQAGQPVVITVGAYEQIQVGMTYADCVAVIGVKETQGFGGQGHGMLTWQNPGEYYAVITFDNSRVAAKTWKHGPLA